MKRLGFSGELLSGIRDSVDCNLYFFGNNVAVPVMYIILCGTVAALIAIYILMNKFSKAQK